MYSAGTEAISRRHGARLLICHVQRVPRQRDLLGRWIPAHNRYTGLFADGRWANDLYDHELAPLARDPAPV